MDWKGKQVLVYGAGKSGIAATRLLLRQGAMPCLYDGNADLNAADLQKEIGAEIPCFFGEIPETVLDRVELVIISPGISCESPLAETCRQRHIPVWGEVELASRIGKGLVLAVTGTNGKTTTVSLLGKILTDAFPEVYVVGNIGIPYTDVADRQSARARTAAEISSFQLETIESFHPAVSAITNITEDHLDRHHDMETYIQVKARIAENQEASDLCVLNAEDPILVRLADSLQPRKIFFSSQKALSEGLFLREHTIVLAEAGKEVPVIDTDELQILGRHNMENVMTAVAMAYFGAGIPLEQIRLSLRAFPGVAHRIEYVEEIRGVRYYNDSKGTNPDAAIQAVLAMDRPTLLIGGGYDKGASYTPWIQCFSDRVQWLLLIGQTREKIREAAIACGFPEDRIVLCRDLAEAVQVASGKANPGDAVLLSPACASWGQFQNYEERGDCFKQAVRELA